jgi:hypothetical protein
MILAPFWPFFRGMVRMAGGGVIEVAFYTVWTNNRRRKSRTCSSGRSHPNTVAIYLNSPEQPERQGADARATRRGGGVRARERPAGSSAMKRTTA